MSDEKLTPERAVFMLRAKAAELEHRVLAEWDEIDHPMTTIGLNMAVVNLAADIAVIATLLADHIERCTAIAVKTAQALQLVAELEGE